MEGFTTFGMSKKCHKCGNISVNIFGIPRCGQCSELISYKIIVNNKFSHYIFIPRKNETGIPTNFFYEELSEYFNIPSNFISIYNLPRGKMMCSSPRSELPSGVQ